ncbi:MAG TPA: hypothetical protein VHX86_17180 [Tepidisphaeraceae bacterium]|nr:hypothetical protein [Tepidisphaeraceae bacterium]
MAKSGKRGWGEWLSRRADFIGYKRQADLAAAVGCKRERIVRWYAAKTPPAKMRKGFDRALAAALQTTVHMLFHDYVNIAPEVATEVMFSIENLSPDQRRADLKYFPPAQFEAIIREIAARMHPDELEALATYAIVVVLAKNDRRRPEFEQFVRQLQLPPGLMAATKSNPLIVSKATFQVEIPRDRAAAKRIIESEERSGPKAGTGKG